MKLESCEACMQMTNHGCLKCASKQSRLSAIDEAIEVVKKIKDCKVPNRECPAIVREDVIWDCRDCTIEDLEALKKGFISKILQWDNTQLIDQYRARIEHFATLLYQCKEPSKELFMEIADLRCEMQSRMFNPQGHKEGLLKAVEVIEGIDYTTWYETNYTQIAKVVIQKLEALIKEGR